MAGAGRWRAFAADGLGLFGGPADRKPQFSAERLRVNADMRSVLRLAPAIEAIDGDTPKLRLTRLAEGRYDSDDLLARFERDTPAPADDKPTHVALCNLRLTCGSVEFDDKPVQRLHRLLAQLALGTN